MNKRKPKETKSNHTENFGKAASAPFRVRGKTAWLPASWRWGWATPLRLIFLVVLVSVVWQVAHDRLGFSAWSTPLNYESDGLMMFGYIEASAEGDYVPFHSKITTRLGAPYTANWNDYAIYEEFLTFVLGRFTNWFGLFTASNVGIMGSYATAVLAFYACSRLLRHRKEWAMAFAILFAFAFYTTRRGLPHLVLSYTFTVPLAVVSCWLVLASKRIARWNFLWWFCVVSALAIGFNNPYNVNLYGQFILLALLGNFLFHRRRQNLETGAVALALAGFAFIAINWDTISYGMVHGKNPSATPRSYFQTEMAALKPLELVIPPPTHHAEWLADLGRHYATSAWVRGELFSPYLGIVGVFACVWLCVEFVQFVMNRRRDPKHLPPHLPQCAWIFLYSVIGGINCIIGLFGILYFRSSNRYSIFISAICLLFAASAMSRVSRKWGPLPRWGLATLITAIGLWDQLPRVPNAGEKVRINTAIANDRAFGEEMEKRLPPATMVFQLPVMRFPEGGPVGEVTEYEMLRPYYFTRTLRFSFGSNQGRPRDKWQFETERMPPEEAVRRLESYGFGAVYLDRRGIQDRGEKWLDALKNLGRTESFQDSTGNLVCVALKPAAKPELPHSDDEALVRIHSGLAMDERTQTGIRHWMSGDATFSFFSEDSQTRSFALDTAVASLTARKVSIEYNGRTVWSADLQAGMAVPVKVEVEGRRGYNRFHVRTDQPPQSPQPDGVRIAYALINPRVMRTAR
jgi:hypothetical protein